MTQRRLVATGVMWMMAISMIGQGPYRLNAKAESILFGSAALMSGITLISNSQIESLTEEEIALLDVNNLLKLDRGATKNWSREAYRRSNYGEGIPIGLATSSTIILPAVTDHEISYGIELATLLVILAETNLINSSGTHMIKNWTRRTRPYVYNPEVSLDYKQKIEARKSFFSGHVSTSAANSVFLAKVLTDYFPESKIKPLIWSLALAFPVWTGIERYNAGRHFPTDIVAGFAFGAVCGYFIPHLHKHGIDKGKRETNSGLSLEIWPLAGPHRQGVQMLLNF